MSRNEHLALCQTKDFDRFLKSLARRGGTASAVHQEVVFALVHWKQGLDAELPLTHHGEPRVPHVVKYDLKAFYRLVVYEHAGKRIPLMVGDHEEVERWLDNNRGRDFTVKAGSKRIQYTPASPDAESTRAAVEQMDVAPTAKGPLLSKLAPDLIAALGDFGSHNQDT